MANIIVIPEGEIKGGLLLTHAWWGLNDFIVSFCKRLAGEGFLVLAPDLYHGAIAKTIPDAEKLRSKLKREQASREIMDAFAELQLHPALKSGGIGALGFSLGAYWTLWLAEEKAEVLQAVVLYYGSRSGEYTSSRASYLGHFAENDHYVALSGVKKLEKTLTRSGHRADFHIYPNTSHWFSENDRPEYDPAAESLAWQRTIDFLHQHLA